jgi:hypothetical protein
VETRAKVAVAAGCAVVLAGAGVGIGALAGGNGGGGGGGGARPSASASRVDPLTGRPGAAGPLLAVKIDNVAPARPAVGLGKADIVYVERVEGGLSRFMAVYGGPAKPAEVGPVRSARETDLQVLSAYGKPAFAYSGAVSGFLPVLARADVVNVSPAQKPGAYFRSGDRSAPHNMFVRTAGLTSGASVAKDIRLRFGAAPAGGTPAANTRTAMPAASFRFTWNPGAASYTVLMDGRDTAPAHPQNVIIQHVQVTDSPGGFVDTNGGGRVSEPFSRTVGSGTATVLRDGRSYAVTWTRPDPASGTTFTYQGKPFPLHTGQTWIVLN